MSGEIGKNFPSGTRVWTDHPRSELSEASENVHPFVDHLLQSPGHFDRVITVDSALKQIRTAVRCRFDPPPTKPPNDGKCLFCVSLASCFFDGLLEVPFLIELRIGTRLPGQGQACPALTMHEVSMTPFPSAVHKSRFFELGNELPDLPGHTNTPLHSCVQTRAKPVQPLAHSVKDGVPIAWYLIQCRPFTHCFLGRIVHATDG